MIHARQSLARLFPTNIRLGSMIILATLVAGHVGAEWSMLEGDAVDLETERVVYQERHSMGQGSDGRWIMESDYIDAQGELFAERTVWFDPQSVSYTHLRAHET